MNKDIIHKDTTLPINDTQSFHKPFSSADSFSIDMQKKTEKISTALYMVTSVLDNSEPMRLELRSLAIRLVKDASTISVKGHTESIVLERLESTLRELLAMTEIATSAGLISDMNGMILNREFKVLKQKIYDKEESSFILPESLFTITDENISNQNPHALMDKRQGILSDTRNLSLGTNTNSFSSQNTSQKFQPKSKINIPKNKDNEKIARDARRNNILKIIKDKKEVTIKDIVMSVSEYSEKTIQRELSALVSVGVLKKIGEKRWSKYSLK